METLSLGILKVARKKNVFKMYHVTHFFLCRKREWNWLDKAIFLYLVSIDICTETRALLINCSSVSCAYGLPAIVKSHLSLEDN